MREAGLRAAQPSHLQWMPPSYTFPHLQGESMPWCALEATPVLEEVVQKGVNREASQRLRLEL